MFMHVCICVCGCMYAYGCLRAFFAYAYSTQHIQLHVCPPANVYTVTHRISSTHAHTQTHRHTHIYIHIYIYIYDSMQRYKHAYTYIHKHTHTHTHTHTHIYIYIHTHIYIYIYMHISNVYLYIYIYIYIYIIWRSPTHISMKNIYIYTYIFIYIYANVLVYTPHIPLCTSSSSWRATSMDFPDPFPSFVSIIHRSWQVFHTTSCISTELLLIGSSWSPNPCSSVWRGPLEYNASEFVLTSPAVSCIFCSSNLDVFCEGSRWP